MNIIKCGLDSKDEEVIQWAGRTIARVGIELEQLGLYEPMWKWFSQDELLDTILLIMDTMPHIQREFVGIFPVFSRGHFKELILTKL